MRKGPAILSVLLLFFSALLTGAQVKKGKGQDHAVKKTVICKSSEISFPCPEGYKVLLNGNDPTGAFLARNPVYGYSVFVIAAEDFIVAPPSSVDEEPFITGAIIGLLKILYPRESQVYRWKIVDFANARVASDFEVRKKLIIGFHGKHVVTIERRYILLHDRSMVVGTLVDGVNAGEEAEREFDAGISTSSGACLDAVKIIHSVTGEAESNKLDPCKLTIRMGN